MATDHVLLPDGRHLDVRVVGAPGDPVLVCHHGTPGAASPFGSLEDAVTSRGLRLVTMSRAGYGGSTRHAGRHVVDVVADTRAVLADLEATNCLVMGWSGGGPHALACAARLDEATAALVIAGVGPYGVQGLDFRADMGEENVEEFGLAIEGEAALRPFIEGLGSEMRTLNAAALVSSMPGLLPDVDRAVLTDDFAEDLAASFREAMRIGVDGMIDDDLAFTSPWGFDLSEIRCPVSLWQGSADLMVPFAHGQWLADHIPGVVPHLEDGEGHLSVFVAMIGDMLDELIALGLS